LSACGGNPESTGDDAGDADAGADAGEPIKIGGLMAMTGGWASDGEDISNAINLAVDQRNAAGGVAGREIQFDIIDSASTPDTAVNAANKVLRDDSYDVVFGPHFSSQMLAIADLINETSVLQISGSQSMAVPESVTNEYTTWNRVPDIHAATATAEYLDKELGCKKIGIMAVNDDFGETAKNRATAYFDENGIEYVVETYGNEDKDVTTQILNLRKHSLSRGEMIFVVLGLFCRYRSRVKNHKQTQKPLAKAEPNETQ
jgi:branched-chain amino acid transport system substrate-binding protein